MFLGLFVCIPPSLNLSYYIYFITSISFPFAHSLFPSHPLFSLSLSLSLLLSLSLSFLLSLSPSRALSYSLSLSLSLSLSIYIYIYIYIFIYIFLFFSLLNSLFYPIKSCISFFIFLAYLPDLSRTVHICDGTRDFFLLHLWCFFFFFSCDDMLELYDQNNMFSSIIQICISVGCNI